MESIMKRMESKEERKKAEDFVHNIFMTDRELYDRALTVLEKLGLGGLWQGVHLAWEVVIKALQEEHKVIVKEVIRQL